MTALSSEYPLPPRHFYILDSVCEAFVKGLLDATLSKNLLDGLDEVNGPIPLAKVYEHAVETARELQERGKKREKDVRRAQKRRRTEALEELYGYISDVRSRNELVHKRFGSHVNRIVDFLDELSEDPGYQGRAPWE